MSKETHWSQGYYLRLAKIDIKSRDIPVCDLLKLLKFLNNNYKHKDIVCNITNELVTYKYIKSHSDKDTLPNVEDQEINFEAKFGINCFATFWW